MVENTRHLSTTTKKKRKINVMQRFEKQIALSEKKPPLAF